jgi:hypothetical protein
MVPTPGRQRPASGGIVVSMTRTIQRTLVRSGIAGLLGLACCSVSTLAPAQGTFGRSGSFVVSGERLTGVFYNAIDTEADGFDGDDSLSVDTESSATTVAFLGSGLGAVPSGVPRATFDYFFTQSMSLGLALGYGSRSNTDEISGIRIQGNDTPVSFSQEVETTDTLFMVAPRFGYAMSFSPLLGLWARGSLLYTRFSQERQGRNITPGPDITVDSETTVSALGLGVDAQLMISPVEHVAFGVGPLLELSPLGDFDYDERTDAVALEGDADILSVGLSAGISVWF